VDLMGGGFISRAAAIRSVVCSSPKSAGQITGLPGERVDVLSLCEL